MPPAANSLQIAGNGGTHGAKAGGAGEVAATTPRTGSDGRSAGQDLINSLQDRVGFAVFWLAMYVVAQVFGVLAGLGDWARGRGRPERWVAPPWSDDAWRDVG
jgi:hypothetical protein